MTFPGLLVSTWIGHSTTLEPLTGYHRLRDRDDARSTARRFSRDKERGRNRGELATYRIGSVGSAPHLRSSSGVIASARCARPLRSERDCRSREAPRRRLELKQWDAAGGCPLLVDEE